MAPGTADSERWVLRCGGGGSAGVANVSVVAAQSIVVGGGLDAAEEGSNACVWGTGLGVAVAAVLGWCGSVSVKVVVVVVVVVVEVLWLKYRECLGCGGGVTAVEEMEEMEEDLECSCGWRVSVEGIVIGIVTLLCV
ncbi:hypothetical protein E2C01_071736 [Portunus trituberculatus]|uniref:Transmembrane protein n=1 Tax=Portunus trituberculatus TaxID=210409 RepID=A0A5B7I575_PORTR|nr:hypothetical protein [Portunus trituberculatus]